MIRNTFRTFIILMMMAPFVAGCASDDEPPLEGERRSILQLQKDLEPGNIARAAQGFVAPDPWKNEFWPQVGGYPNHAMQHLHLQNETPELLWRGRAGNRATERRPLTAGPIVAEGRIYVLDPEGKLMALDKTNGRQIWRVDTLEGADSDHTVIGGGVSYSNGRLYVTNGLRQIRAYDLEGQLLWAENLPAPSRTAPTIVENQAFVVTLDNRLSAHNTETGALVWDFSGISESAGLMGAAAPAATHEIVLAGFSSGELYALRRENGTVTWSENLAQRRAIGGIASISDIVAPPVIDKGLAFAISFGGRLMAIDERSGTRVWERDIGGTQMPWVAGNTLFLISANNELAALSREEGDLLWVIDLNEARNTVYDRDGEPELWYGPLYAGNRLWVISRTGDLLATDPNTGGVVFSRNLKQSFSHPPVVAGGTIYLLSDDAQLFAFQ